MLQDTLIDSPEELPGLRYGHLYRSATQGARVGGDFYDIFEVKKGRLVILIGMSPAMGWRRPALPRL